MRLYLVSLLLLPQLLTATQTMPWFGNVLEFEWRNGIAYQSFNKIDGRQGDISSSTDDFFAYTSLALVPFENWSGEIELQLAEGRHRAAGVESVRATGRYLILDDLAGDIVSLSTGLTGSFSPDTSVNDPGTHQVGNWDIEGHLAVGHESSNGFSWNWRVWGVVAAGYAFKDCPWIRYDAQFAVNANDQQEVRLFLRGLWGFGEEKYDSTVPFRGYGSVAHRSVDLGARVSHYFENVGTLSIEVARRMIARNYPKQANYIAVEFLMPFGL